MAVTEEQVLAELRGLLAGLTDEDMATVTQGMLFQQLQDQLGGRVALSPFRAAVRREVDSFLRTPRKPGVVGDDDSVELEEQASEEESEDDFEEEETDEEGEEGWKQPRKRAKTSTKAPAAAQKKKPQPAAKPAAAAKPAPAAVAGDLGARLLAALSGESQTAAQLGKALGQPKSAVNSLLYKLASSGQAVKEDGVGAPKWRAAGAAADAAAATRLKMEPVDAPAPAAVPAAPAVTAPAPPPPTAAPAAAVASGDDSTKIADLGSNKRLTVSRYKGQTFINIREYYLKDGAMLPGSKGISLPVEQWRKVCDAAPAVDQALQARK